MPRLSHDRAELVPVVAFDGPTLDFDFPGLEIGVAEYDEGPTGCTVFHFPEGADCSTDVRGGSPGTTGDAYPYVDAICLAGGSIYGLEAVAGGIGGVSGLSRSRLLGPVRHLPQQLLAAEAEGMRH